MNKVCVITGASGIICAEFAKEMSKNGYVIALLDINEDAAKSVADEIYACGGLAKAYKIDIFDKNSIEAVHKQVLAELGKCTVLINGINEYDSDTIHIHESFMTAIQNCHNISAFFNLNEANFSGLFDPKFKRILLPTQIFAQDMIGCEGCSIINISSINTGEPFKMISASRSSNAPICSFTKWLATHFAKEGIRVNGIAPGFLSTMQNMENGTSIANNDEILAATPMGRLGEVHELLGVLKFLADPVAASFVTGTVIPVDGGFSAHFGVDE